MTFHVTRLGAGEEINFDTLPVAKIAHYPLETGDYKPYTQCSFCVTEEGYAFRMMAFEAKTTTESKIIAYLYPFPEALDTGLMIAVTPQQPQGATAWIVRDEKFFLLPVKAQSLAGEDLQGVFWGWDVFVSFSSLAPYGEAKRSPGQSIPGNFYKIQEVSPEHYGSFSPISKQTMEKSNRIQKIFKKETMGTFEIVPY